MSASPHARAEALQFNEGVIAEFRGNHGNVAAVNGIPLMLLTTIGAKSNAPRTSPLTFLRDGARFVIYVTEHAAPRLPDWYFNLLAHSTVTVELADETFEATARVLRDAERQRWFDAMLGQFPDLATRQAAAKHELPVVMLERTLHAGTDYAAFNRALIAEFRANGGKVGGMFRDLSLLLLTTTGARSGAPRTVPVAYGLDGDIPIILASKGGSPTHPDWYINLRKHPEVTVDLGSGPYPARAHTATGEERERLSRMMRGVIPNAAETQSRTSRQIPVVLLERTA